MSTVSILTGSWAHTLEGLVSSATDRLTLCAPYVSGHGTDLVRNARGNAVPSRLVVLMLTDLSPMAVCTGATDPVAIAGLAESIENFRMVHLPRLHAKVYVADGRRAVVTSGNLTNGGLRANFECGVYTEEPTIALEIEGEVSAYASLGAVVDRETLARVCEQAVDAKRAYMAQTASASRESTRRLRSALKAASDTLLLARLADGPIHTVFAGTIEFLLRRHGPLSTQAMHQLIQRLHPDLCDDSVDRVIDGKRFGKKWKHAVRTAQQQLKKRGVIALIDGRWLLVD